MAVDVRKAARALLAWAGAMVALGAAGAAGAAERPFADIACQSPPPALCAASGCPAGALENPGNATEAKSGRRFFLDYPCDLKRGEKVVFVLLLHGHGSSGAWVRNYFPAAALKEKLRLVVATPTAGNATHDWKAADDGALHDIAEQVIREVGPANIKAFWLAGHSAGGANINRIVCDDYFRTRVDGWLSLSGGRIGKVQPSPDVFGKRPPGAPPPKLPPGAGGVDTLPACDFSFIFESGDREIVALPATSPWAAKYGCGPRRREADVVDVEPGRIDDVGPGEPNPALGRKARPGTAQVIVYPRCQGGRVIADVLRLDKGHTEGLEPLITETLVKMMAAAPGGRVRAN